MPFKPGKVEAVNYGQTRLQATNKPGNLQLFFS